MEKIILHAHSCWSHDSSISLTEWRTFIIENKISMLYLTEHEESGWDEIRFEDFKSECAKFSCDYHQIIPGLEMNIRGYHVLVPGLKNYKSRPSDSDLDTLRTWVESRDSFLIAAHPDKYSSFDEDLLDICVGIEIVNTKHQYNWFITYPTFRTYELMQRFQLRPFVGQDIHRLNQFSAKGVLMSNSSDLFNAYSSIHDRRPTSISEIAFHGKNHLLYFYTKFKRLWIKKR